MGRRRSEDIVDMAWYRLNGNKFFKKLGLAPVGATAAALLELAAANETDPEKANKLLDRGRQERKLDDLARRLVVTEVPRNN